MTIKTFTKWTLGLLIMILGIFALSTSVIASLLFILVSLLLIPISYDFIKQRINISKKSRNVIILCITPLALFLYGKALAKEVDDVFRIMNKQVAEHNKKTNDITELSKPKMELYRQFDFIPEGEIIYQFYHEYGFTDKIWHLTSIVKPKTNPKLAHNLPLDKSIIKELEKIDVRKFIVGKPIIFGGDYIVNSDVTIDAQQFLLKDSDLNVNHTNGSYQIEKNGDIEIIRIYDADKNIEYIELKK